MFQVLETLFPIVFTIALGMMLTKKEFLSKVFLADLNKFIFWVGLPLMIIKSLATADSIPEGTLKVFGIFLVASVSLTIFAFCLVPVIRLKRFNVGAYLQASFRGNLAFIAIPIILFSMRQHSETQINEALTLAVFVFAPTMIYYNATSVIILMKCHSSDGSLPIRKMIFSILTNPLICSSLIGVILFILPFELPRVITNTLGYVGNISGPAALLCVGGGMAQCDLKGQWLGPLTSALLKVFVLPVFAYFCALFFNLSDTSLFVLLVLSASPTAVASYVVVKAMHGDEGMASSAIVFSTVLSVFSLCAVIANFTPPMY